MFFRKRKIELKVQKPAKHRGAGNSSQILRPAAAIFQDSEYTTDEDEPHNVQLMQHPENEDNHSENGKYEKEGLLLQDSLGENQGIHGQKHKNAKSDKASKVKKGFNAISGKLGNRNFVWFELVGVLGEVVSLLD